MPMLSGERTAAGMQHTALAAAAAAADAAAEQTPAIRQHGGHPRQQTTERQHSQNSDPTQINEHGEVPYGVYQVAHTLQFIFNYWRAGTAVILLRS